jgi:hypothetical protein
VVETVCQESQVILGIDERDGEADDRVADLRAE